MQQYKTINKGEIEMENSTTNEFVRQEVLNYIQKVGFKKLHLRMLMNNLDPEVAEKPEELVVYGGIGKCSS